MQELGKSYGGYGHIKTNLKKYCDLAGYSYVFIITDLDRNACAPSLRKEWTQSTGVKEPLPKKMLFCVAQTEIESWLMADTAGLAAFLEINAAKIHNNIETKILDAKEHLVNLARTSRSRDIRTALTPEPGSKASTGLDYNYRLINFVQEKWDPEAASQNSASLTRAITKLSQVRI